MHICENISKCVLYHKVFHCCDVGDSFRPHHHVDTTSDRFRRKKSKHSLLNDNREIWIHEDCLVWSEVANKMNKVKEIMKASPHTILAQCIEKKITRDAVNLNLQPVKWRLVPTF
jgi:hypothetical protein